MSSYGPSLKAKAAAELELRRRARLRGIDGADLDWQTWLERNFSQYVGAGFSDRHIELWEWIWAIKLGVRPPPFAAVWPRGGGKSTSMELGVTAVAVRKTRRYALYNSETQDQADKHVETIASMLESIGVDRAVNAYGSSKGWRRSRLITADGFVVDALGLDSAARGIKFEEKRPDLMVLDDLDGLHDSAAATKKKIETLTQTILPAGSPDLAVVFGQNLIHEDSIMAQLVDGRADFLLDRIVSGPHPAITDFAYELQANPDGTPAYVITSGTATWAGQSLEICQGKLQTSGPTSFLREQQQVIETVEGGIFSHLVYRHCRHEDVPRLVDVQVWLDPAVTNTDQSDSQGMQVDGRAEDGTIYRLYSWEQRTTPLDALRRGILKAIEYGASCVGVETDQGGDTWQSVYDQAWDQLLAEGLIAPGTRKPTFKQAKAGSIGPKTERASQMLVGYEQHKIVHVLGTHAILEAALKRFPAKKPYDLVDAAFWSWKHLYIAPSPFVAAAGAPRQIVSNYRPR